MRDTFTQGIFSFLDDYNKAILEFDSSARKATFPSGATLSVSGTFSLGGTTVSATAAELNSSVAATGLATDGLTRMGIARFTFDAGVVANRTQAAHGTGVTLPINAIVIGGFYDVNTGFTSAGGNAGTIAISVEGANDIVTATAVSNAIYGTIGRKPIIPKSNTPDSTSVKCTAAREITCTVATQDLTAGKLTGFLHYVVSVVSA
jgi:hypothetical protein